MEITNKVALITGGGSGIGRATAIRLAAEGASVVVVDVDEAGGRETVASIEQAGGNAAFVRADVTSDADVRAMIDFAERTYGGLDILHNNAGTTTGPPRYPETPVEQWSRIVDINLRGVILGTQFGIQAMRKRGGGCIIQTASLAGIIGFGPDPVYSATKGGVVLFTNALAYLKDEANIRVNCVCPGVVDTPLLTRNRGEATEDQVRAAVASFINAGNILKPEDIADAVVELIDDDTLAGRAMLVPNAFPRYVAPVVEIHRPRPSSS
jgi:NAD(P)-dependent dehydrogenase (short-subunit alcohol dehydrogenase family)